MQNSPSRSPLTIKLDTPHYIVRTLEEDDAKAGWNDWMRDPAAARNLNARPAERSEAEIRAYIRGFNRTTAHLLGIIDKETNQLIGVRAIYINPSHTEFLVNVLVGESQARNKGARTESSEAMYRYFFEELGFKSAICTVVSTNDIIMRVMDKNGWVREHTEHKASADSQGFIELHRFRLTREAWERKEAKRLGSQND